LNSSFSISIMQFHVVSKRSNAAGKKIHDDLRQAGDGSAWPVPPVMLFTRLIILTPWRAGVQWPGVFAHPKLAAYREPAAPWNLKADS
jgi:hypothetical protein